MIRPQKTLLFLCLVFAISGSIMWVFPEQGIAIGQLRLDFPSWEEFWSEDRSERRVAMDELFDIYANKVDSTAIKDSLVRARIRHIQKMKEIQFPQNGQQPFKSLGSQLAALKSKGGTLRVLHYGDSQIEGDRITSNIRNYLQRTYGGEGSGWMGITDIVPNLNIQHTFSDNWSRYTVYGKSSSVLHKKYGLLGAFSRFTPEAELQDTARQQNPNDLTPVGVDLSKVGKPKPVVQAWFELVPSKRGFAQARNFKKIRIALGNVTAPLRYNILADGQSVKKGTVDVQDGLLEISATLAQTPGSIRVEMEATESPDFYGVSLEGNSGVLVDNIAMRGSSGTIFNKMDAGLLRQQYGRESIGLVILQYGGNSVPYINSEKQAKDFGGWFEAQIRTLKKMLPNAAFVVIGPSDMATKVKDKFVTYPYLEQVRDALKQASFNQGVAYWDMFEAMGGKNAMSEWVIADPPLASPDHIHFTPAGAKTVSEWFVEALKSCL